MGTVSGYSLKCYDGLGCSIDAQEWAAFEAMEKSGEMARLYDQMNVGNWTRVEALLYPDLESIDKIHEHGYPIEYIDGIYKVPYGYGDDDDMYRTHEDTGEKRHLWNFEAGYCVDACEQFIDNYIDNPSTETFSLVALCTEWEPDCQIVALESNEATWQWKLKTPKEYFIKKRNADYHSGSKKVMLVQDFAEKTAKVIEFVLPSPEGL